MLIFLFLSQKLSHFQQNHDENNQKHLFKANKSKSNLSKDPTVTSYDCDISLGEITYLKRENADLEHRLLCNGNSNNINLFIYSVIHVTQSDLSRCDTIHIDLWTEIGLHLKDVHITTSYPPIYVSQDGGGGTLKIFLEGTNSLEVTNSNQPAILCNADNVIIEITEESGKTGSLTLTGSGSCSAIGPNDSKTCKGLNFVGGTVTANGGSSGPGIGPCRAGTITNITISGGEITANGNTGAGIGTGESGSINDITISGGKITANGNIGAGIGTGESGSINVITISGGEITAKGYNGAGIGTGVGGSNGDSNVGTVTISEGTITAYSNKNGAGIGTGYGYSQKSAQLATLQISGGSITAYSKENGAGIGTGYGNSQESSQIATITISGGDITAYSEEKGAGIGGGYGVDKDSSQVASLSISNCNINATGSSGAGIGAGYGAGVGTARVSSITFTNSNINAIGSYGAGIGGGYGHYQWAASIGKIIINSGIIYAYGNHGSGIGCGYGEVIQSSYVEEITINGGSLYIYGGEGSSAIGGGPSTQSGEVSKLTITTGVTEIITWSLYEIVIGRGSGAARVSEIRIFDEVMENDDSAIIDLDSIKFSATPYVFHCRHHYENYIKVCSYPNTIFPTYSFTFNQEPYIYSSFKHILVFFSHYYIIYE